MPLLLLVSLLWAFSPGLIKHVLGDLPSPAVATVRLGLTFLVFAPFLRPGLLARRTSAWLAGIGAVQFGLMYLLYLQAFKHLQGHEVFLFTILTPLYVVLLDAAIDNKFVPRHGLAALLSVVGAGLIIPRGVGTADIMTGFLLVQGANLCFAAGQVAYKRTRPALAPKATDAQLFAWLALGGFAATALVAAPIAKWSAFTPDTTQWLVLAFLGLVASGGGFFLWNLGLARVNAGTLAAMNNAKIPLGVAVSLLVFREPTHLPRLIASLLLLGAAVWIAESGRAPAAEKAPA
jgi:drug/metabolite transporter (DMT)-like permease